MEKTGKFQVTKEHLVEELAGIAFAKATDVVTVEAGALVVGSIPREAEGAVQSVEKTSTGIRVRFYDKLKALELLGKAMGLFDGLEDGGENNLLSAILAATGKEEEDDL